MLGNRLKELRLNKNLTQSELSSRLNISQITYSQYERGKREPSIETLIKLAELYLVSMDYLLCRYDKTNQN